MSTPLLNARGVATRLGCSVRHVYGLWDQRALPCVEIPGSGGSRKVRRLDAAALETWIAAHTTPHTDQAA